MIFNRRLSDPLKNSYKSWKSTDYPKTSIFGNDLHLIPFLLPSCSNFIRQPSPSSLPSLIPLHHFHLQMQPSSESYFSISECMSLKVSMKYICSSSDKLKTSTEHFAGARKPVVSQSVLFSQPLFCFSCFHSPSPSHTSPWECPTPP